MARFPRPDNMTHPLAAPMAAPRFLIKALNSGKTDFATGRRSATDTNLRLLSMNLLPGPVGTSAQVDTLFEANHTDPTHRGPDYLNSWFSILQIDPTPGRLARLVFHGRVDGPAEAFSESPNNTRTLNLRDHWFLLGKRTVTLDASRLPIAAALYRLHAAPWPYPIWPTDPAGEQVVTLDPALFAMASPPAGVFYRNQPVASVIADLINRLGNHIAVIDYDNGHPVIRARELGKTELPLVVGTITDGAANHRIVPFCQSWNIRKDFNAQYARAIGTGGQRMTQKVFDLVPAWDTTDSAGIAAVLANDGGATLPANDWIGTCYEIPESAAGLLLKPMPPTPSETDTRGARRGAKLFARTDPAQPFTEYKAAWDPMVLDPSGTLTTVFDEIPRVSTNRRWFLKLRAPAISYERGSSEQAAYLANATSVLAGGTPASPSTFAPTAAFLELQLQAVAFGSNLAADSGDVGSDYYPDPGSFFAVENPNAVAQVLETEYEIDPDHSRVSRSTTKKTLRDDSAGLTAQTLSVASEKAKPTVSGAYKLDNLYPLFRLGDAIGPIINTEGTTIRPALGVSIGQITLDAQEFEEILIPNDLLPRLAVGMGR